MADPVDPVGFGGQHGYYHDYTTGLYLLTHRYYDANAGRFVTRDPLGYKGGINLYGFAGNNPVNRRDASGFAPEDAKPGSNPFMSEELQEDYEIAERYGAMRREEEVEAAEARRGATGQALALRSFLRNIGRRQGRVSGFRTIRAKFNAASEGNEAFAAEIRAAAVLSSEGHDVAFLEEEGVGKNPDLSVDGEVWDVYSPITKNPNRIISELTTKAKQGATGVVLDLSRTTVNESQLGNVLGRLRGASTNPRINNVLVLRGATVLLRQRH